MQADGLDDLGMRYLASATDIQHHGPFAHPLSQADDLDDLDYDSATKPFWRRKTFWLIAGPLTVSAAFLLAVRLAAWGAGWPGVRLLSEGTAAQQGAGPAALPARCRARWMRASHRGARVPTAPPASSIPLRPASPPAPPLQGVLYLTLGSSELIGDFQVWRLCFFLAG